LARARTGSGKTGAYAIPAIQKVLEAKEAVGLTSEEYQTTRAVILVPTRELAMQVHGFVKTLTTYCEEGITAVNAASGGSSVTR
jgi:ATP-dependent RNA helicase DDX56/DBP9